MKGKDYEDYTKLRTQLYMWLSYKYIVVVVVVVVIVVVVVLVVVVVVVLVVVVVVVVVIIVNTYICHHSHGCHRNIWYLVSLILLQTLPGSLWSSLEHLAIPQQRLLKEVEGC